MSDPILDVWLQWISNNCPEILLFYSNWQKFKTIFGKRLLTPLFYEHPFSLYCLPFSNFVQPPLLFLLPFVFECLYNHDTFTVLFWLIILVWTKLCWAFFTFAPAAPPCVFYAAWHQSYRRFDVDCMAFANTLI